MTKFLNLFISRKLYDFGIEVHQNIAKTGVVGVLHGSEPGKISIGLRADMDALELTEENIFEY